MPRKKQKGPPPRSNRPGPKQNQGQGQAQPQGQPAKGQKKGGNSNSNAPGSGGSGSGGPQKLQPLQMNQRPIVPFLRGDRILLIGEGDFSFAKSLVKQYKCRKLCATAYDSKETLFEKYPQTEGYIQEIVSSGKGKSSKADAETEAENTEKHDSKHPAPKVLFSIDARKLGSQGGGGKEIRSGFPRREKKIPAWKLHQRQQEAAKDGKEMPAAPAPSGPWDVICFNFPHVGGLSTDVNRQVRANQELLVSFFKSCIPLLSTAPEPVDSDDEDEDEDEDDMDSNGSESDSDSDSDEDANADVNSTGKTTRTGPGQILVSLFEAEPYTLWNIKDLARHAGLQVVTSFRFPWESYEGYSHARTLGEVEGKNGGRGGWRGEDRDARMYVFEVRKEVKKGKGKGKPKGNDKGKGEKKRARDEDSDSE